MTSEERNPYKVTSESGGDTPATGEDDQRIRFDEYVVDLSLIEKINCFMTSALSELISSVSKGIVFATFIAIENSLSHAARKRCSRGNSAKSSAVRGMPSRSNAANRASIT